MGDDDTFLICRLESDQLPCPGLSQGYILTLWRVRRILAKTMSFPLKETSANFASFGMHMVAREIASEFRSSSESLCFAPDLATPLVDSLFFISSIGLLHSFMRDPMAASDFAVDECASLLSASLLRIFDNIASCSRVGLTKTT